MAQRQRGLGAVARAGHLPDDGVKPARAPVQVVRPVVGRDPVGHAVEVEGAPRDPVSEPPDQRAKKRRVLDVAVERVEPERHVGQAALPVGDLERHERAAEGQDLRSHSVGPRQRVKIDGTRAAEQLELHLGLVDGHRRIMPQGPRTTPTMKTPPASLASVRRGPALAALCAGALTAGGTASRAAAADYYVAPGGSANGAGTMASPWTLTRAAATNGAGPGDTVYIRGGMYSGAVYLQRSGTAAAWITFRNYPGELPIIDGGGSGGTGFGGASSEYIRVIGLAVRNFSSSGFANRWVNDTGTSNGHFEIINCIAESNGVNGIAFYNATGLLVDGCIVAHNGNRLPSWSSGVNLFHVMGGNLTNVVRRTVSFENIDISDNHTDGSGFILDQNSDGATFENNIGFRNGGSCIRLTNSPNARLINNTCYHDGLDMAARSPNNPGEILFSNPNTMVGVTLVNNLLAASGWNNTQTALVNAPTGSNNLTINANGPTPFFVDPAAIDLRIVAGSSTVIDRGTASDAPATDIGFDPRCVRAQPGQAVSFWQHAPDYEYIRDIGGVPECFHPAPRPVGAAPDIGAYEYGGAASGGAGGAAGTGGAGAAGTTGAAGSDAGAGSSGTAGRGGVTGAAGAAGGAGGAGGGGSAGRGGAGGSNAGAGGAAGTTAGIGGRGGASGIGGTLGAAGAAGAAGGGGATGAAGAADRGGATGAAGAAGRGGATGAAGAAGTSGSSGAAGAAGAAGASGAAGTSGAAGMDGLAGTIGTTGAAGTSGAAGADGGSGAGGATGDAGTTGAAGIIGTGAGGRVPPPSGDGGRAAEGPVVGGCDCSLADRSEPRPGSLAVLLVAFLIARRRRGRSVSSR